MSVEIGIELTLVTAKAPLVALGDVFLQWPETQITIRRCAVFEKADAAPWANLPHLPIERHGKRSYVPLIDLSRDLKKRVMEAVHAEYEKKRDAR